MLVFFKKNRELSKGILCSAALALGRERFVNRTLSLEELVSAALKKDTEAFTELVFRHQNLALGTALTLVGDRHSAQDIVQESFLTAYQRLGTLREPAMFPGWLRGIVRHSCHRDLRRRKSTVPLQSVEVPGERDPVLEAENQELIGATRRAIENLPPTLQEVVYLYYLQDQSQAAVASYLDKSVSTVNNLLHGARQQLKRTLKMVVEQVRDESLERDFAERIGRVLSVTGAMIDAQLQTETGNVFDAMSLSKQDGGIGGTLRVIQRLGAGKVRCQVIESSQPARPGMDLVVARESFNQRLPEGDFAEVLEQLSGPPCDELFETGIKPLDFFCPVSRGGLLGFFGTQGVGRIVFERELYYRFSEASSPLTIVYFAQNGEAGLIQRLLSSDFENHTVDVEGALQTVWLVSQNATDPEFLLSLQQLDASLFFDPMLAFQGLYPAIDGLRSRSRLVEQGKLSADHSALRLRVLEEMRWKKEVMADTTLLEHGINRSMRAFEERLDSILKSRLKSMSENERVRLARARKLERFFTTPFYVAKDYNGLDGETVSLEETLSGLSQILAGDWDESDESEFLYQGALKSRD